jgi:hypothetical protein
VVYPNLFYVSYFIFLCNCFLKFIVYKMNSKMVTSRMVVQTRKEKIDMADTDVIVGHMF